MKLRFMVIAIAMVFLMGQTAIASNEIRYSGSSTIGNAILDVGGMDAFQKKTGIKFASAEYPGSSKGMKALIAGNATLGGASRALKSSEKKSGVLGTIIGYDAIGVCVNKSNPVNDLSKEQLKDIFTGKIKNWSEVGGPDQPISVNTEIQGEGRATMEMFQKMVMDGADYGSGFKEIDMPKDQIVQVASDKWGIGTPSVGLISAVPDSVASKVKFIAVDSFEPNPENIEMGAYLISRPLVLGTMGIPKGSVKKFIDWMLSPEGQTIVSQNFVPVR